MAGKKAQETVKTDATLVQDDLTEPFIPVRPGITDAPGDELPPGTPFIREAEPEAFAEVVQMIRNELTKVLGNLRGSVRDLDMATKLVGIGPERVVDVIFNDVWLKYYVPYAGDDQVQTRLVQNRHLLENDMLLSLIRKVSTGGVILDIGGYIGEHAVFYSKTLNPKHIHVFEPQRICVPIIEKALEINGISNATVHPYIVADGKQRMALGRQKHHRLDETSFVAREDGSYEGIAIDDLKLKQVDFVKMHFDGTKMLALRGMENTLRKFMPTICTEATGRDIGEQEEFLQALGYRSEPLPHGHFLFFKKS